MFKKGNIPWHSGLTKETDVRLAKSAEKISKTLKGRKKKLFSKEHCASISQANKGCIPWNKGLTKETDKRVLESSLKQSKSTRGMCGGAMNGFYEKQHTSKSRIQISKTLKFNYQNLEYKNRVITAIRRGNQNLPTFPEKQLNVFLDVLFPGDYKYVGDGQIIVGGKNPDYMNINGQKKFIEMFGDHWHKKEEERKRIDLFKKYGYDTLVAWEHELKDVEKLMKKLFEFHNS